MITMTKDASISSCAPSWEEIAKLLKQVPCFIEPEPPSTDLMDFFSLTHQFFVDIASNPSIIVAARLPRGTLESVFSRIQPMQDYTVVEMIEVVSLASS